MKIFRIAAAVVVAAIGLALMAIAPALAADPFGTWLTEDKKGKIHIVNCGGALCGNLVWIKEPLDPDTNKPKLDKHNVDASKQSRPLLGIPIVLNMKPSGTPEKWDGQVYNAEDGNTYSGSFTMTGANTARTQGLRARRADLQGADLDADELTPGRLHSAVVISRAGRIIPRAPWDRACRPRRPPRRGWQRRASPPAAPGSFRTSAADLEKARGPGPSARRA